MGEIRRYFDAKFGTGKLVSRSRDSDSDVIRRSSVPVDRRRYDARAVLLLSRAASESVSTITVTYKAILARRLALDDPELAQTAARSLASGDCAFAARLLERVSRAESSAPLESLRGSLWAELIDEQDTVEVIDLVLERACSTRLLRTRTSRHPAFRLRCHGHGTVDVGVDLGKLRQPSGPASSPRAASARVQ
jgi:hypothetical protein